MKVQLSVRLYENRIIVCLLDAFDCHTRQLIFYWC